MELNVGQGGFSDNPSELPGFRFYPTDQELVGFYLKRMVQGKLHNFNYIRILDLYRYDPWDLPSFARLGERELFFFVPRDEKTQKFRGRPNRITASGYWKATGSDRFVREDNAKCIGLKKTLVFYRGRAPLGQKTDWIMNEYRLPDTFDKPKIEVVLCRIHKKGTSLKWLEHKAMSQVEVTSTNEDLDCISPDSQLSPAKIDDDKRVDREAKSTCHEIRTKPSSSPQDNGTKGNTNSSLGSAVDSELNNLMESTIDGGLIDPVFQTFGNESNKVQRFSSLVAMLAASPSSCAVERCWDPLLHSAMAEEPTSSARILQLSLDFCNEKATSSGNGNLQNPWTDLWSPSTIISTPHCFHSSSVDFLGHGHGGL